MISHTRCLQTINVEHLLSSSTSSYINKNIFSVAYSGVYPSRKFWYFLPRFWDKRLWGFCWHPNTKEVKFNLMCCAPSTQKLHINNSTATWLYRNNVPVTVDNLDRRCRVVFSMGLLFRKGSVSEKVVSKPRHIKSKVHGLIPAEISGRTWGAALC